MASRKLVGHNILNATEHVVKSRDGDKKGFRDIFGKRANLSKPKFGALFHVTEALFSLKVSFLRTPPSSDSWHILASLGRK
jgi:hypothetical protein